MLQQAERGYRGVKIQAGRKTGAERQAKRFERIDGRPPRCDRRSNVSRAEGSRISFSWRGGFIPAAEHANARASCDAGNPGETLGDGH